MAGGLRREPPWNVPQHVILSFITIRTHGDQAREEELCVLYTLSLQHLVSHHASRDAQSGVFTDTLPPHLQASVARTKPDSEELKTKASRESKSVCVVTCLFPNLRSRM